MIRLFNIWVLLFLCIGCSKNNRKLNFEYIKIIYSGYGHTSYTYYDPVKDSIIYQVPYKDDTLAHKTMAGRIGNSALLDTFVNIIQMLKHYKNGGIPVQVKDGSFYCGPVLYTEFKDELGVHFYSYSIGINDTLDQFVNFYENLQRSKWKKKRVKNELVDINGELESANQYVLSTRNKDDFYSLLPCGNGIDVTKLYGSWRSVRDSFDSKLDNYTKLTIKNNGTCLFKRVVNDTVAGISVGKVSINNKNGTIVFTEDGKEYPYTLTQLCDNCLQYRTENDPRIIRFDRFYEPKKTAK